MVSAKGKEKVTDGGGKGKRKWGSGDDDDKTGRKRKNRGVLQFFEDTAYQVDEDEDSSDDSFDMDDFLEDEFNTELQVNNEPGKVPQLPFVPKEEEMSEEELERMLEERYKPGAGFVTYADDYEQKKSIDRDIYVPSAKGPTIWKVKCTVGRERHSAFCLMQKYVDLENLGTKLQIISACALDNVKGFIFVEAEKQNDIYEACKGLPNIYSSRVAAVPNNEFSRLLSFRSKSGGISEGMWARVKNGKYKGDLGQVVAVNHARKKVTVKLVPRIDLKALAEKFGGGVPAKRNAIPPQRLISARELEEFRPLIQTRRDRDTNQIFEVLDGMMLKDGYLCKKIPIDSLSFWGVLPTEDELLKFEPAHNDESTDVQWLSQLFGENKKKEVQIVTQEKGGGKSEGSSIASMENNFEVHDLVFFGRKDFGVVIGTEKDDSVKVMKQGSEGPSVVTVKKNELKTAAFDKKLFSVLDQHSNTLSVNDTVRVLDGPLKDRQGIVKKIYKGILFLFDESEQENNGYICAKALACEKVNLSGDASNEKGSEPEPSGFADSLSSPKSPLSPDKSLQERDNKSNFARDDNAMFSVGQSLRIRVGPLKGYLCRVLAIRRSDVTVKLDSQQKILTVKSEHLSEVRAKNSAIAQGDGSGSLKPFDFLGSQDGAKDWMDGAALSTQDDQWNAGGSTERTSWSTFPSSNFSLLKEPGSGDPVDDNANKEDSSWQINATQNQNSSWGVAAARSKMVPETGLHDGWAKPVATQQDCSGETVKDDSWGKAAEKWSTRGDTSGIKAPWGQSGVSSVKETGGWANAGADVGQPQTSAWTKDSVALDNSKEGSWQGTLVADKSQGKTWGEMKKDGGVEPWGNRVSAWGKGSGSQTGDKVGSGGSKLEIGSSPALESGSGAWGNSGGTLSHLDAETGGWKNSADKSDSQTAWGTQKAGEDAADNDQTNSWDKPKSVDGDSGLSWNKQDGKSSWGKTEGTSSWSKPAGEDVTDNDQTNRWDKPKSVAGVSGVSWNKQDGKSSWGKSKPAGGDATDNDQTDSWDKPKSVGGVSGVSWNKQDGKSSWGKPESTSSWSKPDGESSCSKPAGGSSWTGDTSCSRSAGKSSLDENPTSDWSKQGNWGSQKASEENSSWNKESGGNGKDGWGSSWKNERNDNGGSSTGWGQSNWGKSGTSGTGGNQDSAWSSKSNWNLGGDFGGGNNRDETSLDSGRGVGWRGGRGGRGDRGGFRGRGRSDRGGFGGRGGSDSGGFGGRGERGGFEGRGRGRGGYRGRGRGDWNNRDDSNVGKSYNWNKGSDNNAEGWKSSSSGGSWKQRDGDSNLSQSWGSSWNQAKGDASHGSSWNQGGSDNHQKSSWNQAKGDTRAGEWGKANDSNKDIGPSDTGSSGWGSSNASAIEVTTGWGKPAGSKEMGGWNKKSDGGQDDGPSGSWGKAATSSWGVQSEKGVQDDGPSGSWGKAATSSWGGQSEKGSRDDGPSGSWGKAATSSCGSQSEKGGQDDGPSGSWGKPATSSWGGRSEKGGQDDVPSGSWGKPATSSWGGRSEKGGW